MRLHYEKTALFLGTAIKIGWILAGAPDEVCEQLKKYGTNLGLLFQITDDILDVEWDITEIGKSIGKDTSVGKWLYKAVWHNRIHTLKEEYLTKTLEIANILDYDELKYLATKIAIRKK
jgi:geranylgeranyl pyrophosphate synthase